MDINEVGKVYERPWGTYRTIELASGYQVKVITVNPGGQLSLQKHFKRAEHWVVVKGSPTFTIGDTKKMYHTNDHVYIEKEEIHRMENTTNSPCEIVEVQIGSYLGEDDIVRLEDIYNR
ncbi:phosphomannose isomerase type II C-terminal cupin domain [Cysteiniphilum halobium]|uniref:phosphomannose isomerase type II C-terminal cupin domain n=1 Tax=Cysteiniphilum halobium TaxID=2219059 RepID=UPI000E654E16